MYRVQGAAWERTEGTQDEIQEIVQQIDQDLWSNDLTHE